MKARLLAHILFAISVLAVSVWASAPAQAATISALASGAPI